MTLPNWLLGITAWAITVSGVILLAPLLAVLVYAACNWAYVRGRFAWEFMWFARWRFAQRRQRPEIAGLLEAALRRAERSEREAKRAEAKGFRRAIREFRIEVEETALPMPLAHKLAEAQDRLEAKASELEKQGAEEAES